MGSKFFECGQCGHFHAVDLPGWVDCRDDLHRFTADQLDERFGSDGWQEVDYPDPDAARDAQLDDERQDRILDARMSRGETDPNGELRRC